MPPDWPFPTYDTSTYGNYGPPLPRVGQDGYRPRCGHCGRFIGESMDAFEKHINDECPVGGVFVNGKLRRAA